MLNDFVNGKLACKRSSSVIAPIKELIKWARGHRVPIIYVNDEHHKNIDHELKLWGDHAIKGTNGAKIINALKPQPQDFIIPKRRYSGFFETNLHSLLQELKSDTLIICGIYTDLCIAHTVADAYQWGYQIIIPADATISFAPQANASSLQYFKQNYAAKVKSVNQITNKDFICKKS
jgi:nicotinamidase-related amidase